MSRDLMSVINMFRKEALRHQYKSQEFGHSVIKQPSIISNAIIGLCAIILIGVIVVQFVTLTTNHAYDLGVGAENYQPLVMSKAVVVSKHLALQGSRVNTDQVLANLTLIDADGQSRHNTIYLRSSASGYYFPAHSDSNIIAPYQPIGYLLKFSQADDFSFWLQQKPKSSVKVGSEVKLILDERIILGRIAMVVGAFVEGRGQKILVRFEDSEHFSILSPDARLKIVLQQQPKTIAELLG